MSDVTICNGALDLIAARTIDTLSDDVKEARLCSRIYATTRDDILRQHKWNFALTRAALTADSTAPAWGFSARYALPSDCLRLLDIKDAGFEDWRIEGRWILTDRGSPLNVLYVSQVTDTALFDSMFVGVLEAGLAHRLAYNIAGSRELAGQMFQLYQARLALARSADASENGVAVVDSPMLLEARL